MSSANVARPRRIAIVLIPALLGLACLLAGVYLLGQRSYTIYDGQVEIEVNGRFETVGDVLAAAELTLQPEDLVAPQVKATAEPDAPIRIDRAQAVTVQTAAGRRLLRTQAANLGAFLKEEGLSVRPTDRVVLDGRPADPAALASLPVPDELIIDPFKDVILVDGGRQQTIRSNGQAVRDVLQQAGIALGPGDSVSPPPGTWLTPGMVVEVERAAYYRIAVDGRALEVQSDSRRVSDILAEAGVAVGSLDVAEPDLEAILQPGDAITITRVTEEYYIEEEEIPFETVYQPTEELELDATGILSQGAPGVYQRRYRIRYENGVAGEPALVEEGVVKEPVNRVIGYGTRIVLRTVDTPDGPKEYWRVIRMRVTAYTAASAGKKPTDPGYGITASGVQAGTGVIAVDPDIIPFRSYVYVPGYGVAFAGDTGGGIKGRFIDLGYDEDEYVSWSGEVDVYYLTPAPPPDRIRYLLPSTIP